MKGSATADMNFSREGVWGERDRVSSGGRRMPPLRLAQGSYERNAVRESEPQGARMPDHDVARLRGRPRADLAERRAGLLGQQIDHVAGATAAERAEAPQEGLAGERR